MKRVTDKDIIGMGNSITTLIGKYQILSKVYE